MYKLPSLYEYLSRIFVKTLLHVHPIEEAHMTERTENGDKNTGNVWR